MNDLGRPHFDSLLQAKPFFDASEIGSVAGLGRRTILRLAGTRHVETCGISFKTASGAKAAPLCQPGGDRAK